MIDQLTPFRALLTGSATITALVPAARIYMPWYPVDAVFPLITYTEINNFTDEMDYFDDLPQSETSEMEVHVFTKPDTSPNAIARAIDGVLSVAGWNRDYSAVLQDPSNYGHRIMTYSKRSQLTI